MAKKAILIVIFFTFLPILILCLTLFSLYLLHQDTNKLAQNLNIPKTGLYYNALPETNKLTVVNILPEDARVSVLKEFFSSYQSPLEEHAKDIVFFADKFKIDYRLLPAIAMQESNLCKKIPINSFNCWGFGIYGGKVTRFKNYNQAIETISKTLAKEYHQKGFDEPIEIMSKYTPSSNGSWAKGVNFFMDNIQMQL